MPFPIAALLPLIGSAINSVSTGINNRQQRKFSVDMYNRQRQDSISDWNMQNSYNSPAAQMARFKEAGLNPHLIYKQTNEAPAVRSSSPGSYNPEAPQIDPASIKDSLFYAVDLQSRKAQANNLELAGKMTAQQMGLVAAQTLKALTDIDATKVGTSKLEFELNQAKAKSLYDIQQAQIAVQQGRAQLEATETGTQVLKNRDQREAAKQDQDITESITRVAKMKAEMSKIPQERELMQEMIKSNRLDQELKALDKDLKEFEKRLNQNGITKTDPAYYKIISNFVDQLGEQSKTKAPYKLSFSDKWPYFQFEKKRGSGATGSW